MAHHGRRRRGVRRRRRVVPFPDGADGRRRPRGRARRAAPALAARSRPTPGIRLPLADVELLAPLVPASVRDFVAFEEHVEGVTASIDGASHVVDEWYEFPTFYFTNPHSIIATGAEVRPPRPSGSTSSSRSAP